MWEATIRDMLKLKSSMEVNLPLPVLGSSPPTESPAAVVALQYCHAFLLPVQNKTVSKEAAVLTNSGDMT